MGGRKYEWIDSWREERREGGNTDECMVGWRKRGRDG